MQRVFADIPFNTSSPNVCKWRLKQSVTHENPGLKCGYIQYECIEFCCNKKKKMYKRDKSFYFCVVCSKYICPSAILLWKLNHDEEFSWISAGRSVVIFFAMTQTWKLQQMNFWDSFELRLHTHLTKSNCLLHRNGTRFPRVFYWCRFYLMLKAWWSVLSLHPVYERKAPLGFSSGHDYDWNTSGYCIHLCLVSVYDLKRKNRRNVNRGVSMHVRQVLNDAGQLQQVPGFVYRCANIHKHVFQRACFRKWGMRNNLATNESTCSYQGSN